MSEAREFLRKRKAAYLAVFPLDSPPAIIVLSDMAMFCHAHRSTFHPSSHVQAAMEGRREYWLRVQQHLHLTNEQLWTLLGSPEGEEDG